LGHGYPEVRARFGETFLIEVSLQAANPLLGFPDADEPAFILEVDIGHRINRARLILEVAEIELGVFGIGADVAEELPWIGGRFDLRIVEKPPRGPVAVVLDLAADEPVVEDALPPAEHGLRALERWMGTFIGGRRGRVVDVHERQEVEVEVGEVLRKRAARIAVICVAFELRGIGKEVSQLGLAALVCGTRGEPEAAGEEHSYEGALIGSAHVAQGAGVVALEESLRVFAAAEEGNAGVEGLVLEVAVEMARGQR